MAGLETRARLELERDLQLDAHKRPSPSVPLPVANGRARTDGCAANEHERVHELGEGCGFTLVLVEDKQELSGLERVGQIKECGEALANVEARLRGRTGGTRVRATRVVRTQHI